MSTSKLVITATMGLSLIGALMPWVPFLREGEERSIDARFQLRGPRPEGGKVVVVAIDDATEKGWRDTPKAMWAGKLAELVSRLDAAGTSRIALDFVVSVDADNYLASKGIDELPNAALDEVIINSGERVLLGTSRAGDVVSPLSNTIERLASVNQATNEAGVVRQIPRYDFTFDPPLMGLAAALVGEVGGRTSPIHVNYSGRPPVAYSARDVLDGRVSPDVFRGALVIVGETYADSPDDQHETPFEQRLPGVFVHAEAARTLLDRKELRVDSIWTRSVVTLVAALFGGWLASRVLVGPYFLIAGSAALFWSLGSVMAFSHLNWVMSWFTPMLALVIIAPGMIYAIRAFEEARERAYARTRWGQLVGESTVRRLEENRKSGRGAWGNFDSCLMFLDIAGFSRITRKNPTAETLEILNRVFSATITHVDQTGGEVIDFAGDGLAAKWEVPALGVGEDPHRLVLRCALAILKEVDELNRRRELGPSPVGVRIGLSHGQTTLALVGSEGRQKMTLVGEVVNLAARLEQLGKDGDVNSRLVVSVDYSDAVTTSGCHFERGQKELNGWDAPVDFLYLVESSSNVT